MSFLTHFCCRGNLGLFSVHFSSMFSIFAELCVLSSVNSFVGSSGCMILRLSTLLCCPFKASCSSQYYRGDMQAPQPAVFNMGPNCTVAKPIAVLTTNPCSPCVAAAPFHALSYATERRRMGLQWSHDQYIRFKKKNNFARNLS